MTTERVTVQCPTCGKLGEYYVTPEQHMEGAVMRAQDLAGHHEHVTLTRKWSLGKMGWEPMEWDS